MPRPVDGDEWLRKLIKYRNRGGDNHEFGVMPRLVGGDSQIQAIYLLEGINTALNCDSLSLNILGVIRNFSTIGRKHGLHIQYLKRLEVEHLDNTLSILKKNYKLTGKPLQDFVYFTHF